MQRSLPHVFSRVFNAPLAIQPDKLEALLAGLRAASVQRGSLLADDRDDAPAPSGYAVTSQGVAYLPIHGVLAKREGRISADSTMLTSYAGVGTNLRRALADPRVTAIMLEVDSPGGEVGGLFELVSDIRQAATIKPVWAMANDDALSAGYAIASAASRLWISEMAGVGNVGVVAMHTDQSRFDAEMGLTYTYIYAGARKVEGNPHEPLSAGARATIQAEVDRIYDVFVSAVANHRGLKASAVRATEAAVYFGPNAVAAGLADQVGTLPEAIAALGAFAAGTGRTITMDEISTTASGLSTDMTALVPALAKALGDIPGRVAQASAEQTPPPQAMPTADEIAAAVQRAAAAEQGRVVDLDAVRNATTNVRREIGEIVSLCNLAGSPELSSEYIAKGTELNAVRTDLQRRKAEATEAQHVETIDTSRAATPGVAAELNAVLAARWADQMSRH